ncbi:MAG TPA: choice-of-anchor Q domain-containing protein [Acidimicrobiales bacterium]|nr:choice-of-anchor Q domain-containing protein [Acidimicrobiales bacterium]
MHQTFTVNNNGDTSSPDPANCAADNANTCTLRDAVTAANADTGNTDGITVPSGMTVTLTDGFIQPSNSMLIEGAGATVDGGGAQIFYENAATAAVQISGLTLTNGSATDGGAFELFNGALSVDSATFTSNTATADGGAIYAYNGQLWIDNSTFTSNTAEDNAGGGLYIDEYTTAFVENSTFGGTSGSGNTAEYGAGIDNSYGSLILNDSNLSYNTSGTSTYGYGVGLYNDNVTQGTGDVFDNNSATAGGEGTGVANDGQLSLSDSNIDNNSTTGGGLDGGGLYDDGYLGDYTNVTVNGSSNAPAGGDVNGGAAELDGDVINWQGGSINGTTNGTDASSPYVEGGAIYEDSYDTTVSGVTISNTTNNSAPNEYVEGGAVAGDGGSATFANLTVTNTSNTGYDVYGGAFYLDDSSTNITVQGVSISGTTNHATDTSGGYLEGGVIDNYGNLSFNNSTAQGTSNTADVSTTPTPTTNSSEIEGGNIYTDYVLQMNSSSFANTTDSATGGAGEVYGGAIYNEDWVGITNVNMTGYTVFADYYVEGGLLDNSDNSFLHAENFTAGGGTVDVPGSTVETASVDGSILYNGLTVNLVNATLDDVTTTVAGSGSYAYGLEFATSGGQQLTNTTIANNAMSGPTGSTYLVYVPSDDTVSMLNTIVSSTTPTLNCGFGSAGQIVSQGYNLDSGSSCNLNQPGDISNADPMVQPLANNGGQVLTGALAGGSPAVDAGTNHGCPNTDARGVPRPQGATCDIGAYEYVHQGYWMTASDGGIFSFGNAQFYGSMGGKPLNKPVVGMGATSDGLGYWEVASDGGIFAFGDANFYGSMGGKPLNAPMVGITGTADKAGYWEVASDGGIFAFGDAGFYGSMGGKPLNKPIVGIAATPDGKGYWEVASDGGIFSFGDAGFYGSTGAIKLNKPMVGMTSTPSGGGYWLVASDGGIFNYGNAGFYGSTGAIKLNKPVVGMGDTPSGNGYFLFASDGGVFTYGDGIFQGSMGGTHLNQPVVGGATTGVMPSAGAL